MLWALPLVPLLAGPLLWAGAERAASEPRGRRLLLGSGASVVLAATLGLAVWAAASDASAAYGWSAALLLEVAAGPIAGVVAVLVPAVALPVVVYAAAHEEPRGLGRLVGLLVAFVGCMELLVVADDLLTVALAWELVGAVSWALIAHEWRKADLPRAAAHAFNTSRLGGLGLFLALGAAFAGVGSLRYDDLARLEGAALHVVVAGVVLAALTKSGQVPFSPWLFSAMGGPTPVSALLHSATMVAAGAYLLARLVDVGQSTSWFGPVIIAFGLVTAFAGGVVACLQPQAKKLLAASTSAHYGYMFVAVGAGAAGVAVTHLVVHAAFKALLFLAAGLAMSAVGSGALAQMRLGSGLRWTAWLSLPGALALAAIWPLGGAWSKEKVVAAAVEGPGVWVAVLVAVAGALSAFYAARFQLLTYGWRPGDVGEPRELHQPGVAERGALGVLALASVVFGLLWVPGAKTVVGDLLGMQLPAGASWEVALSLTLAGLGVYAAWTLDRSGRLVTLGMGPVARSAADWLALPTLVRWGVVNPSLALAAAAARFDDLVLDAPARLVGQVPLLGGGLARSDNVVVDAGVRGAAGVTAFSARVLSVFSEGGVDGVVRLVAAGAGAFARDARRLQTGMAHHYYVIVAGGLVVLVVVASFGR